MALNVLLVEDDLSFINIVQIRLKAWRADIEFHVANTIADAQTFLAGNPNIELAILDHHLPDGLGSELFDHPKLTSAAVLAVSSDEAPEIPAKSMKAGAQHFLNKRQVMEPLFIPLINALIERKKLEQELLDQKIKRSTLETVSTLVATLEHEINNPLGAVLGGAFLIKTGATLTDEQFNALKLIEESGARIRHVIKQLRYATDLEQVTKGKVETFHIPGDEPWEKK